MYWDPIAPNWDSYGGDYWEGYDEWLEQWEQYQEDLYWGDQGDIDDIDYEIFWDMGEFEVDGSDYTEDFYDDPLTGNEYLDYGQIDDTGNEYPDYDQIDNTVDEPFDDDQIDDTVDEQIDDPLEVDVDVTDITDIVLPDEVEVTPDDRDDDDIFVLPDFPVIATEDNVDSDFEDISYLTGNEYLDDEDIDIQPLDLDLDEVLDATPDPDISAPYKPDRKKLQEIADRYKGTRREFNEWSRSEEGQKQIKNLGEKINQYLSPSEGDPLTKADALTNQIINLLTGGGLTGLDAFAQSINIIEGALGVNIMDVPNGGYLVNNVFDEFVDEDDVEKLKALVPDFVDAMTGIRGAIDNLDTPTAFLGNDFDLSNWLLGDASLIREIDFGLNPAQEQLDQQAEDFYKELLGPDYDTYTAIIEPDDPSFWEKLGQIAIGAGDAFTDITEDIGFTAQKYLGGALPRTALNVIGGATLGLPVGTVLDIVTGAMTPSGQNLSEYLYEKGIDPTTATRRDVAAFVSDVGYDVPNYNPETGDFDIPVDNTVAVTDEDAGFLDNLGGLVGGTAGEVISGDTDIGGVLGDLAEGTTGELTDIVEGVTGSSGESTTGGVGDNFEFTEGVGDDITPVFDDDTTTTVTDSGNGGVFDDNGVDGGDIFTGGTGMAEDTTNMTNLGDVYDPAYFTALSLLGADRAEAFRGRGLADPEFRDIVSSYTTETAQAELERLAELNRLEQERINEQRAIQRGEDLSLLGDYGMDFAEAVRGLDPMAQGMLGQQVELADRLYGRAAGELSPDEQARAAERAFEISAMAGPARAREGQRFTNVLRAEEDMIQNLEGRAQAAGGLGFNMSRALTGDIPSALLGTGASPYGTGVGTVVPAFGIGDVISQSTNTFAQQQNVQKAEQQLQQLNADYSRAIQNNEPSTAEKIMGQINDINNYLNIVKTGASLIGGLPDTVSGITSGVQDIVSGIKTFFGGGSTAPQTTSALDIQNYLDPNYIYQTPTTNINTGFGNIRF